VKFKTDVTNIAIESAAEAFVMNLDNIMAGDGVRLLTREGGGKLLEEVKQFAVREIYSHPSAERVELAGRQVIAGMLEHFHRLLKLERDEFIQLLEGKRPKDKNLDFQLRLLRLLPPAYCDKYKVMERGRELERRAHLIVDFIAGMTDDYALQTYQVLQGIRIQ
jgi:dGTPase